MSTKLTIDDGLKASLGYCDGDDSLSPDMQTRMSNCLATAENIVRGAIGDDVEGFMKTKKIKHYTYKHVILLAATYYSNPSTMIASNMATLDIVANAIIGQLRGRYDVEVINGSDR